MPLTLTSCRRGRPYLLDLEEVVRNPFFCWGLMVCDRVVHPGLLSTASFSYHFPNPDAMGRLGLRVVRRS